MRHFRSQPYNGKLLLMNCKWRWAAFHIIKAGILIALLADIQKYIYRPHIWPIKKSTASSVTPLLCTTCYNNLKNPTFLLQCTIKHQSQILKSTKYNGFPIWREKQSMIPSWLRWFEPMVIIAKLVCLSRQGGRKAAPVMKIASNQFWLPLCEALSWFRLIVR